jgi:hypothetical protein
MQAEAGDGAVEARVGEVERGRVADREDGVPDPLAGIRSTSRPSVSAERITGATLNDSDWWVNSRTT